MEPQDGVPEKNRLYRNNHDGTFTDVAEKAGVALGDLGSWSSGATWGDYDGDGRLDLFVAGYVHFDRDNLPVSGSKAVGFSTCQYRGATVMCGPRGLKGEPDHLFHNNGNGTFTDVSVTAGVDDKNRFYGFESIFVDVNGDGKPDLLVDNDSEPNFFYINKGDGTFEDQGYMSGFALNKDGREIASMGIAVGDYENSGELDFAVTDFSDDYKVLYRNSGDATLTDVSYAAGIAQTSIPFVGWGDGFIDYDNDGWLDLFMVNGHVYPQVVNRTQYYYYFAPLNPCCSATSPYRIIYGRSTNPDGAFVDRGGVPLYDANGGGGGTILLSSHGHIVGPGGQSVFTDTGADGSQSLPTLVYHYYDGDANGTPKLGVNRILFTADGGPYLE
jgi:hypothetical protein